MLMKLADGKLVVCNEDEGRNNIEVLLRTLLSDNKDSLPGRSHLIFGSKVPEIIEWTVKQYGEHWKCLRERYSPARMTKDRYSALKGTEEEVETTSETAHSVFTRKSEMAESSDGNAESKGKRLGCTTGIASPGSVFDGDSFNRPPLSDLLKRCEILNCKEEFGYNEGHTSINKLVTLVAEGKLTNGLCVTDAFDVARSVASLLSSHPAINILLVDWNSHLSSSFKHTRVLQISLGSNSDLRNISEGEPDHHIKISLDDDCAELTEANHVSLFQSIVMPVAKEFKPDMVFFVLNHLSTSRPTSCIGHLIGMLMKVAHGKVVVCNYSYQPDALEVSLRTLLSDNKDSLPGPSHPTAEGSIIIEKTVKKYGDQWKCLRERYSAARITKDKYSDLEETEEEVETTSKNGSESLQGLSTYGSSETQKRHAAEEFAADIDDGGEKSLDQMTLSLPPTSQERSAFKQEEVKLFGFQCTDSTESKVDDEDCEISPDVPCSSRHTDHTPCRLAGPSIELGGIGEKFKVSSGSKYLQGPAKRQMRDSAEEVTGEGDARMKNQHQMNMSLPSTSHGRITIEQQHMELFGLQKTDSVEYKANDEDVPCSSRYSAQTLYKLTDPSVELGAEEFNYSSGSESVQDPGTHDSAERQKRVSTNEAAAADDDGQEKCQDQVNLGLPATTPERFADVKENIKLHDQKSRKHFTLEELEEMADLTVEKEVGSSGDTIRLHAYEITFPAGAVDENIKARFRLSFLAGNLCLPDNLIPIAHPIFCSPGKTVFKQDVIMKIPVWFKVTDTSSSAKPTYVHLYTRNQAGMWEVLDLVQLGTSETITFKCKHFCPIIPCVEQADADHGEFTLDYFLSMDDDENFASCHCVSSDALVETMEKRMEKCGFRVIHPATTRQSVKPNTRIPVSLTSKQPQTYEFESDGDNILFIDDKFFRHQKREDFSFVLVYRSTDDVDKIHFTYKVGDKSHRKSYKQPKRKHSKNGQGSMHGHLEGSKNGSQTSVKVDVHVGDTIGEINANAIATRNGVVTQDQSNCRNVASSN